MLVKFTGLVEGLVVDVERMRSNLAATRGLVFSQAVLLALVEKGMTRDQAYRLVQGHAMTAWEEGEELRVLLGADPEVPLEEDELAVCFSLDRVHDSARIVFDRLAELKLS
jgi:adenylosuccinate lyase